MNSTNQKDLDTLKSEMDAANAVLRKAVRKARVPSDFKKEEAAAKAAYHAYWSAHDVQARKVV